ncbi:hypothetical protein EZS27_036881, partial [termite gut metagenome]
AFHLMTPLCEATHFEKDLLTGKILSHLNPTEKVRIEGFENIEARYNGYFDVVASNIPFGDVRVFDPAYSHVKDDAHRQAGGTIHNYFFMKGVDCVREGGLVAFITSQGVLNSEANRPVREWLMQHAEPVSLVRFPNNLFTNHAGTEVGSDLVILQKKAPGGELSQRQRDFIDTRRLSNGISINNSFQDFNRVIHDEVKVGTDPYGKPAMEFTHSGGESAIAAELRGMLREDFSRHLDVALYRKHAPQEEQSIAQSSGHEPTAQNWQEMSEILDAANERDKELFMQSTPEDYRQVELSPEVETKVAQPRIQPSLNFDFPDPVPLPAQSKEPTAEAKVMEPAYNLQNQPLLTLYDLFGFSAEERTQVNPRRSNRTRHRTEIPQPKQSPQETKSETPTH